MFVRLALITTTVTILACTKDQASATPDAGTTRARHTASTLPPPPDGPCATDADCKVYLEPCSCGCLAHIGEPRPIPNEQWSTVCSGGPPGNCGTASPCTNVTASCN